MNCIHCGQEMSHHRYSYYNRDASQCEIEIVECANCQIEEPAQLAALREAGEKMAERLRALKTFQRVSQELGDVLTSDRIFVDEDAEALEAWEAANK